MNDSKISLEVMAGLFDSKPEEWPVEAVDYLEKADTRHHIATKAETEEYVLNYLGLLRGDAIVRDTEANQAAWLRGWAESLKEVLESGPSAESCKPKYFRGNKFLRFKRGLIVSPNLQLEYDLFVVARHYLFRKYLSPYSHIYEMGCGSCGNLWMLGEIFPDKHIQGMDWVQPSVDIANEIGRKTGKNISGKLCNMLNPPSDLAFPAGSAVITVHALEQIGADHKAFLESLIKARPAFVLNCEPLIEYYDPTNVYDYLALWYSQKRNYLSGYVTALRELEKLGRIKILSEKRPELGGVLHEASIIAWKPV